MAFIHPGLNDPFVEPIVLRTLRSIKQLLVEAHDLNIRYDLQSPDSSSQQNSTGLDIFKRSFEEFELAVNRNQKQKSVKSIARWAVHDANKFEVIIKRLRGFIDGLQDITKSLGGLSDQQARLKEEIESISDKQSLQLIRDAAGQKDVTEVARQLLRLSQPLPSPSFTMNHTSPYTQDDEEGSDNLPNLHAIRSQERSHASSNYASS